MPSVTVPPIDAPPDGVAHERMPAPFVDNTWPFDPSADGQPYATPFNVVVAETDILVKATGWVPVADIVAVGPVKARVEDVRVTPRVVLALIAYAAEVIR